VEEEHAEVRLAVVGWHQETAVHPHVSARFPGEQLAHCVQRAGPRVGRPAAGTDGDGPALGHGVPRDGRQPGRHDPKGLPGRVVIDGLDNQPAAHRAAITQAAVPTRAAVPTQATAAHQAVPAGSSETVRLAV
jgi:hypothetical protein